MVEKTPQRDSSKDEAGAAVDGLADLFAAKSGDGADITSQESQESQPKEGAEYNSGDVSMADLFAVPDMASLDEGVGVEESASDLLDALDAVVGEAEATVPVETKEHPVKTAEPTKELGPTRGIAGNPSRQAQVTSSPDKKGSVTGVKEEPQNTGRARAAAPDIQRAAAAGEHVVPKAFLQDYLDKRTQLTLRQEALKDIEVKLAEATVALQGRSDDAEAVQETLDILIKERAEQESELKGEIEALQLQVQEQGTKAWQRVQELEGEIVKAKQSNVGEVETLTKKLEDGNARVDTLLRQAVDAETLLGEVQEASIKSSAEAAALQAKLKLVGQRHNAVRGTLEATESKARILGNENEQMSIVNTELTKKLAETRAELARIHAEHSLLVDKNKKHVEADEERAGKIAIDPVAHETLKKELDTAQSLVAATEIERDALKDVLTLDMVSALREMWNIFASLQQALNKLATEGSANDMAIREEVAGLMNVFDQYNTNLRTAMRGGDIEEIHSVLEEYEKSKQQKQTLLGRIMGK